MHSLLMHRLSDDLECHVRKINASVYNAYCTPDVTDCPFLGTKKICDLGTDVHKRKGARVHLFLLSSGFVQ